jgi:glycosyltransferase involved in cell wall biosynthesis
MQEDSRIRYHRLQHNTGAAHNFNNTYKLSRGEFFKWAAYDDECHPSLLRRCVEVIRSAPDSVALVYPQAEFIDECGKVIKSGSDRIESRDFRPHRRLARVVWSLNYCDPVFGLFRTAHLRKTRLIGPYFGADNVLLGELALIGEIWELDEILFRMRMHSRRSMKANPSSRERADWYNPAAARKLFIVPSWERMVWEMLMAVRRSPLRNGEKAKCMIVVPSVHYWRRFRNAGGRVRHQLKTCYTS